jgi:hypothetical protein
LNTLAWLATILGLVATIIGSTLAFMTYISPIIRVRSYLKRKDKWEKVSFDLHGNSEAWRYKPHPEFTIEYTEEIKDWDRTITETWMKYPLPDPSKHSKKLQVKVNGQIILAEEFIALDGGRYFVPLPRVKYAEEKKDNIYYYDEIQYLIGSIVGSYYRMESLDEFVKHQELTVKFNESKWYDKLIP